jgi:hypothetical protein
MDCLGLFSVPLGLALTVPCCDSPGTPALRLLPQSMPARGVSRGVDFPTINCGAVVCSTQMNSISSESSCGPSTAMQWCPRTETGLAYAFGSSIVMSICIDP